MKKTEAKKSVKSETKSLTAPAPKRKDKSVPANRVSDVDEAQKCKACGGTGTSSNGKACMACAKPIHREDAEKPKAKRPARRPASVDEPVFSIGSVIISDEVRNGKKAKSPLMVYASTPEGFRLCDENNIALALPYTEAVLLELGYTIAGTVDTSKFKVDDSSQIESIESTETGEHVVTVIKTSKKQKTAVESGQATPKQPKPSKVATRKTSDADILKADTIEQLAKNGIKQGQHVYVRLYKGTVLAQNYPAGCNDKNIAKIVAALGKKLKAARQSSSQIVVDRV